MKHSTRIVANGSKSAGQAPDSLDVLLARLADTPLHPDFEAYGFARPLGHGVTLFAGNFWLFSHCFQIETNDPEVTAKLTEAIKANLASVAFKEARDTVRELNRQSFDRAWNRRR